MFLREGSLMLMGALVACDRSPPGDEVGLVTAAAQPSSVVNALIVNTDADAVPTRAVGTTTVNGSVWAAQDGAWSVSLAGTPEVDLTPGTEVSLAPGAEVSARFDSPQGVTIENTPAVNVAGGSVAVTGSVTVTNDAIAVATPSGGALTVGTAPDSPLLVRDADAGGFVTHAYWTDTDTTSTPQLLVEVPQGKLLVVEYLSCEGFGEADRFISCLLLGPTPGLASPVPFRFQPQPVAGFAGLYAFSGAMRLYFSEGDITIGVTHSISSAGPEWHLKVSLSGRLIDAR